MALRQQATVRFLKPKPCTHAPAPSLGISFKFSLLHVSIDLVIQTLEEVKLLYELKAPARTTVIRHERTFIISVLLIMSLHYSPATNKYPTCWSLFEDCSYVCRDHSCRIQLEKKRKAPARQSVPSHCHPRPSTSILLPSCGWE